MICVGTLAASREPVRSQLEQVARWLRERGLDLEIGEWNDGPYAFFRCELAEGGNGAGGANGMAVEGWQPIVRSQIALALAGAATGPLTDRWLRRRIVRLARQRGLTLTPTRQPRMVALARQFLDAPPPETPGAGPSSASPGVSSAAPPGASPVPPAAAPSGAAGRWYGYIARRVLDALSSDMPGVARGAVMEGVLWFRVREYFRALDRAAEAVVAEASARRDDSERWLSAWRGLWAGPPPRIYEVHVLPGADGTFRLLDRWGMPPAALRGLTPAAAEGASEEVILSQLMRLNPRRIVVHVPDQAPLQASVRAAFPGKVHSCRGCNRCARRPVPTPAGRPAGSS